MIRFRIYLGLSIPTEAGNPVPIDVDGPTRIVAQAFPEGFSRFDGAGYWHGQREGLAVFERIGPAADRDPVRALAEVLKSTYRQTSVLVTEDATSADFI